MDEKPVLAPRSYSRGFGIPMPAPDAMCEMCNDRVGKSQVCTTDHRYHGHGMIHAASRNFKLTWVCDECLAAEIAASESGDAA
jgi:hypothetical protein